MKFIYIAVLGLIFWLVIPLNDKKNPEQLIYEKPTLSDEVLSDKPANLMMYPNGSFNDYTCTDDCSGHEAGYEWAEDNGVTDPNDCDGNSNSFIEGCQSYAEEQAEQEDIQSDIFNSSEVE